MTQILELGSSLVEFLIAIAILAIVISFTSLSLVQSYRFFENSARNQQLLHTLTTAQKLSKLTYAKDPLLSQHSFSLPSSLPDNNSSNFQIRCRAGNSEEQFSLRHIYCQTFGIAAQSLPQAYSSHLSWDFVAQ